MLTSTHQALIFWDSKTLILAFRRIGGASLNGISNGERKRVSGGAPGDLEVVMGTMRSYSL